MHGSGACAQSISIALCHTPSSISKVVRPLMTLYVYLVVCMEVVFLQAIFDVLI